MILFDTETTGLTVTSALPPSKQPRVTQLCAIKLDDTTLERVGYFHSFFDPMAGAFPTPVQDDAARVSGLTTARLSGEPSFASKYAELVEFFIGERRLIAHNLAFDRDILFYELSRIGREKQFPWPPDHFCTVENTEHIKGYRLNLGDLHAHFFGEKFEDAHDARKDTEALERVYVAMVKRNLT